jgi:predicted NAD-dependent protein-ADP-ribosyltransferase YbiA (DUF1768 family)
MSDKPPIRFYKIPDPWGLFSNFSRHSIALDGQVWPSTEHYYQAQKFTGTDPAWANLIRQVTKCSTAAQMGRDRSHTLRDGWNEISFHVMIVRCLQSSSSTRIVVLCCWPLGIVTSSRTRVRARTTITSGVTVLQARGRTCWGRV